jgi:type I restriction enzyme R subunit
MTQKQYLEYTRSKVEQISHARKLDDLRAIWVDTPRRRKLLEDLQMASVYVDVLAEVLGQTEADQFDLLGHLAFNTPLRTRSERATAFINRESRFLSGHKKPAQEVVLALIEKYRAAGIEEINDARVFRVSPFAEMGQAPGVAKRFGSADGLTKAIREIQNRIYI